jgi:hypothetical protein
MSAFGVIAERHASGEIAESDFARKSDLRSAGIIAAAAVDNELCASGKAEGGHDLLVGGSELNRTWKAEQEAGGHEVGEVFHFHTDSPFL